MRKYTNKTQKPKRTKSIAKITFDSATGRSIAEVATYNQKEGTDKLDLISFEITHRFGGDESWRKRTLGGGIYQTNCAIVLER